MDGMSTSSMKGSQYPTQSSEPSTFYSTKPTTTAGGEDIGKMGGMGETGNAQMKGGACKISMLWNWNTIDACFLSESWQIKSGGGFAALCMGVVVLVILLEFLRYSAGTYDQHLTRKRRETTDMITAAAMDNSSDTIGRGLIQKDRNLTLARAPKFRPSVWQQAIRALLHTLHFALAYWIMLLAMYYNGYIIICIIIGAFIGFFTFRWERRGSRRNSDERDATGCHD